jgi:hypothetical protein
VSQVVELIEAPGEPLTTRRPPSVAGRVTRSAPLRPSFFGELRHIVRDVWESRDLVHQLVLRDIRIRYKQAVMGFAWAILMPMLVVA